MEHMYFYMGLCCILIHEMDAIKQKEWTFFPLTAMFEEELGYLVFTALHFPLFLWIFWGLETSPERFSVGLDVFFVIHVGLHILFLWHPKNTFTSLFSWLWILGAGIFGAMDLIL